jgi:hypothetical protein
VGRRGHGGRGVEQAIEGAAQLAGFGHGNGEAVVVAAVVGHGAGEGAGEESGQRPGFGRQLGQGVAQGPFAVGVGVVGAVVGVAEAEDAQRLPRLPAADDDAVAGLHVGLKKRRVPGGAAIEHGRPGAVGALADVAHPPGRRVRHVGQPRGQLLAQNAAVEQPAGRQREAAQRLAIQQLAHALHQLIGGVAPQVRVLQRSQAAAQGRRSGGR